MSRLRILTWHVHGSYLYYLVQANYDFYLPVKPGRPEGYGGRTASFPWPANVHEIDAAAVKDADFDCVLFQSGKNYLEDQHQVLSPAQRELPRIYLEHDPPLQHPASTQHIVDDEATLLVHVTHFNNLMWDSGRTPTRVIDHAVIDRGEQYTGQLERGIAVVNNLGRRGRRLGPDVYQQVAAAIPMDLVGMNSSEMGGLGEVPLTQLPEFTGRYRFFFNPIRYTSLGLAVCEAMMAGIPVLGLATTEMAVTVRNGETGYVETNVDALIEHMKRLLRDPGEAATLGANARRYALERFNITRFVADWDAAFEAAIQAKGAHYTQAGAKA